MCLEPGDDGTWVREMISEAISHRVEQRIAGGDGEAKSVRASWNLTHPKAN